MDEVKSWLQSKTVWAGVVGFLAAVASIFHVDFGATDQAAVIDAAYQIVTAVMALIAVYGRLVASKKLV